MGRELKRVPMDFGWPTDKVWPGYLCPYRSATCACCDGTGHNRETKQISDDFYDFARTGRRWVDKITQDEVDALISDGRLVEFWKRWGPNGWEDIEPRPVVTAELVNAEERRRHIHDAINRWILVETRAKRLGVFGDCKYCGGKGELFFPPELEQMIDAWRRVEPPTGDGYQLWETTSEGSPQSPVFATLDELCAWCEQNATTFGSNKTSAAEWKRMLGAGLVCHREGNFMFM